jgi:hypothetical protein
MKGTLFSYRLAMRKNSISFITILFWKLIFKE